LKSHSFIHTWHIHKSKDRAHVHDKKHLKLGMSDPFTQCQHIREVLGCLLLLRFQRRVSTHKYNCYCTQNSPACSHSIKQSRKPRCNFPGVKVAAQSGNNRRMFVWWIANALCKKAKQKWTKTKRSQNNTCDKTATIGLPFPPTLKWREITKSDTDPYDAGISY
jgi:hypothetical protein